MPIDRTAGKPFFPVVTTTFLVKVPKVIFSLAAVSTMEKGYVVEYCTPFVCYLEIL